MRRWEITRMGVPAIWGGCGRVAMTTMNTIIIQVATDKGVELSSTMWSVYDVKGPNVTEEMQLEEERLRNETLESHGRGRRTRRDPNSTYSFIEKYFEMQGRMLAAHGNLGDHQFGATPITWPLLGKTLPYWLHNKSNVGITLFIYNPCGFYGNGY